MRVAKLCRSLKSDDAATRVVARQLMRSGTSIGANVEEAQAGHSRADFAAKYSIACKEARETHYWLRLLTETDIVPESQTAGLLSECSELIAILTTIVRKVKQPLL